MYFSYNKITHLLDIKEDMVRTIPEFFKLLKRSRPMIGDWDGKNKVGNYRELLYVFFMSEWRKCNPCAGLADEERHEKAVELAQLKNMDWYPDDYVKAAIRRYTWMEIQLSTHARTLISAKRALLQMSSQFTILAAQNELMTKQVQELMTNTFSDGLDEATFVKHIEMLTASNALLQGNLSAVLKNVNDIQKGFETLDKLEEIVGAETAKAQQLVGSRELGNREIPGSY